jgi:hypothetical protein
MIELVKYVGLETIPKNRHLIWIKFPLLAMPLEEWFLIPKERS